MSFSIRQTSGCLITLILLPRCAAQHILQTDSGQSIEIPTAHNKDVLVYVFYITSLCCLQEHELDKKHMVALNVLFAAVRSAHEASQGGIPSEPLLTALSALRPKLTEALDFFDRHLTHEEDRLSPVLRKNLNIPRMRSTIQEVRPHPLLD